VEDEGGPQDTNRADASSREGSRHENYGDQGEAGGDGGDVSWKNPENENWLGVLGSNVTVGSSRVEKEVPTAHLERAVKNGEKRAGEGWGNGPANDS
jgi:hypothetical protein